MATIINIAQCTILLMQHTNAHDAFSAFENDFVDAVRPTL